jgi:hypothetical protein
MSALTACARRASLDLVLFRSSVGNAPWCREELGVSFRPENKQLKQGAAMPTYAYRRKRCGGKPERVETISEREASRPKCPKRGGENVAIIPVPFIAKTSKKS